MIDPKSKGNAKSGLQVDTERLRPAARRALYCMILVSIAWLFGEEWIRAGNYAFFSLMCGISYYLTRDPKNYRGASLFFLLGLLLMLSVDASVTGGMQSTTLWVFALVPMIGGHLLGSRAVVPTSLMTVGAVGLVHLVGNTGWLPDDGEAFPGESIVVLVGSTLGYCWVAYSSRASLERSIGKIHTQTRRLVSLRYKADRASAAKSAFLANISEQVKIPLRGAILDSQGLLDVIGKEHQEAAMAVDLCARRVWHIVNDAVDIARLETGAMLLESLPIELYRLKESVYLDCSDILQRRELSLEFGSIPQTLPLLGDLPHLSRLVTILVDDAASRAKSRVIVNFHAGQVDRGDDRWELPFQIRVEHDGQEVVADAGDVIFGVRVKDDEHEPNAEMGLGLAMAETLAQFMGGSVQLLNEQDRPSCTRVASLKLMVLPSDLEASLRAA